jgi:allantoate deiminase
VMARLCPVAMLFIRCEGGISHNPAEAVTEADCALAAQAMLGFVEKLSLSLSSRPQRSEEPGPQQSPVRPAVPDRSFGSSGMTDL